MRVYGIKEVKPFLRALSLAVLCLSLSISSLAATGQHLMSRLFDTPVIPKLDSVDRQATLQSVSQTDGWIRVAPVGEEFTVLMPERPAMKTETGTDGRDAVVNRYGVHTDGGIYIVTSSPKPSAGAGDAMLNPLAGEYEQPFFKEIRKQGAEVKVIEKRDLTLKGFNGREYLLSVGDTPCVTRVFVTNRRIYTLIWLDFVLADLPGPTHTDRFMKSFTLGPVNKDAAASNVMRGDDRLTVEGNRGMAEMVRPPAIDIDRAPITGPGRGGNTGGGVIQSARSVEGHRPTGRIFSPREVTQKARLLSKPEPQFTEQARQNNINGTVVLSVVLAASGQVINIRLVKGLPYGLNQKAVEAARLVRFTPAIKDGRVVSQSALLEYNFNLY